MKPIETERLLLRPWRLEDAADMYAYAKNPNVGPNAGWKPHESVEESKAILESWIHSDEEEDIWAIVPKETGRACGSIGLHQDGRRPGVPNCRELGYVLGQEQWGKGYMTEAVAPIIDHAFRREKLRLLSVNHFTFNDRSRRVIEKSGFQYEGTLRQGAVLHDGRVADLRCYSLLAWEYRLREAQKQGLSLRLPEELPQGEVTGFETTWQGSPNPAAAFLRGKPYEQWLEETITHRTTVPEGWVPATLYYLVDREGHVAGALDLRHYLNDGLYYGGHIGYGMSPQYRGRGWAPLMLALGLEKAKALGIDRALVTCNDDNLPSAGTIEACGGVLGTIEACGGVLENVVLEEGKPLRRYWIDL